MTATFTARAPLVVVEREAPLIIVRRGRRRRISK
jgi:hypothetical protein